METAKNFIARLRFLLTGNAKWTDADGNVEEHRESWKTRWVLAGIHSWQWKWVNKLGKQSCGCTINPITRRKVLYLMNCPNGCDGLDWDFDG